MTLQELQNQVLKLSVDEKWQLVQTLLSAIQQDTTYPPPQSTSEKPYLLRGLPIAIGDDFDEPIVILNEFGESVVLAEIRQ